MFAHPLIGLASSVLAISSYFDDDNGDDDTEKIVNKYWGY